MEAKNIGLLNYAKILVRFDIPLLFTCLDADNNRYIVVCADEEDGIYVVGKTDPDSLIKMLKNEITMYDFFRQREQVFLISFDFANKEYVWQQSAQANISDDMLPDQGAFLDLNNEKIRKYIDELQNSYLEKDWDIEPSSISIEMKFDIDKDFNNMFNQYNEETVEVLLNILINRILEKTDWIRNDSILKEEIQFDSSQIRISSMLVAA